MRYDDSGRPETAETIGRWLLGEPGLLRRARQLIDADRRDSTALFPRWVEFLLYGDPHGGFNLNREPEHDGRKVWELKNGINRDDVRRIHWNALADDLMQ